MIGVIFLKDVKHSKNICNKLVSVCVFFETLPQIQHLFFIYNGPGQFAGCIANVAWSCSTPITCIAQWWNWGGQPTSLRSLNTTGGVERKCLISEVSQNIPKTKMAMKNPPWMKMYFLIVHSWHFLVFTWRTKKLMMRFCFGEVPVSCVFAGQTSLPAKPIGARNGDHLGEEGGGSGTVDPIPSN